MINKVQISMLILIAIMILCVSPACLDPFENNTEDIEITGEWISEGENQYGFWKQKIVVNNSRITNYWMESDDDDFSDNEWELFWKATLYSYDNDIWNGGESGRGDYGYAVMKYTVPSPYNPESQDKYQVFRWQRLTALSNETTMEWSEGFKIQPDTDIGDCGVDGYYCGVYFDSILDAENTATESEGFFYMYSEITKTN